MIDCSRYFADQDNLAKRTPTRLIAGLQGSMILGIAAEVRALLARGVDVTNLTIGDFHPSQFQVPEPLKANITARLADNQTNYPPAIGVPELRAAIRRLYERELGLSYPEGCVQVGSGARPPIYAAWSALVEPGDTVVYPVPTWNIRYYAYLQQAEAITVVTRPENGFMPTAADLLPYLDRARLVVLNSPLNPSGTAVSPALLKDICLAIVDENRRREQRDERPLMLLYDQVYWQLTFGETTHVTPVGLVPEMAKYTIFVDAISKCWAATGLRVGWAVVPPWLRSRMQPLVGHMGAWAARPEQLATADLLDTPADVAPWMASFKEKIVRRLSILHEGLQSMAAEGLPVDSIAPQGAIYLSARLDLLGRRTVSGQVLDSDDAIRRFLLEEAHLAVVPFTAFGYPENTGWVRLSVGAVSEQQLHDALERLRRLLVGLN